MNCKTCGATLSANTLDHCPHCQGRPTEPAEAANKGCLGWLFTGLGALIYGAWLAWQAGALAAGVAVAHATESLSWGVGAWLVLALIPWMLLEGDFHAG